MIETLLKLLYDDLPLKDEDEKEEEEEEKKQNNRSKITTQKKQTSYHDFPGGGTLHTEQKQK